MGGTLVDRQAMGAHGPLVSVRQRFIGCTPGQLSQHGIYVLSTDYVKIGHCDVDGRGICDVPLGFRR